VFPSELPKETFYLLCGDNIEVRERLKDNGYTWIDSKDLTTCLLETTYLVVNPKSRLVTYSDDKADFIDRVSTHNWLFLDLECTNEYALSILLEHYHALEHFKKYIQHKNTANLIPIEQVIYEVTIDHIRSKAKIDFWSKVDRAWLNLCDKFHIKGDVDITKL